MKKTPKNNGSFDLVLWIERKEARNVLLGSSKAPSSCCCFVDFDGHDGGVGDMTPHIVIDNLTVRYGQHTALRDISGTFHVGSLTAIAGPNGAGKSTLLKAIVGLVRSQTGEVVINRDVPHVIAYLPQATSVEHDFPMTVLQTVCTGFWADVGFFSSISKVMQDRACVALRQVGLEGMENRQISDLSGGQFQRMLFARVIVQNASVILLDEPFAAVDAETTARLMGILLDWHRQGRTVICVLHDLLLIQKYFPDSFVLAGKCLGHDHTHRMLEQKLLSFDLDMAELCAGSEAPSHHKRQKELAHACACFENERKNHD